MDTASGYRDAPRRATATACGYDRAMSIFDRIGNLAKGVWIQNTNPNAPDAAPDAALERELRQAEAAREAAARRAQTRADPAQGVTGLPRETLPRPEVAPPPEPSQPIERDADGAVKRTL